MCKDTKQLIIGNSQPPIIFTINTKTHLNTPHSIISMAFMNIVSDTHKKGSDTALP